MTIAPLLLAIAVPLLASPPSAPFGKPNVVYILADDLGYGDVKALNPQGKIPTPCLNRMAAQGMLFTDAHSGSSVCTPTRYGVLTGRYSWRTRLQSGVLQGYSPPLIEPGRMTVASLLKMHGYATACVGKWHLGMDMAKRAGDKAKDDAKGEGKGVDYGGPIRNGPAAVGFDYYFGLSASLDMPPYVFIENDRFTAIPDVEKQWIRKGPAAKDFEAIDVLPALVKKAVAFIESKAAAAKEGTPFFLYLPLNSPHTPIVPSPQWQGKSGISPYADFVMQTDAAAGQVLDALDRAGVGESTLVIFTSDNGCSPAADLPTLNRHGHEPSGPLRGHKADIWDGGHRVPFLVRWPAAVKAGSTCGQLVSHTDLLATCADLVGAKLPDDAGEDSVSLLPALRGEARGPLRETVVHHSISGRFSIRQGAWKLELCPGSGGWGTPKDPQAAKQGLPPVQLYDMTTDLGEKTNVQENHPEVVERMTKLLEKVVADGRSTPGAPQKNDVAVDIWKRDGGRVSAPAEGIAGKRPNIIFILTDDQGFGDVSANGNPILKTPNLDRLHHEGVRFSDFHVSPSCSPTRSALLSGRHEFKNGVTHTILERERMSLQTVTIAQVLKSAGYTTGVFGKWHLGDEDAYQPDRRGFDEVFIHGAGGIGQTYPGSCGDAPGNTYFNPAIKHNGKFEKTTGFCTDVFTTQALSWIESVKGPRPFFCYITYNAPHGPVSCPPQFVKPYQGKVTPNEAIFFGMIANIDENVGRVLAKLQEWGIEKDTLVVFMNDNGGTGGCKVFNAGLRGGKCTAWEGGTRAASFWRWPGTLRPADVDKLTGHIDVFPTFAALAGAPLDDKLKAQVEGRSLLPLLKNPQADWAERYLVAHVGRWDSNGAKPQKFGNGAGQCSIRNSRYSLVHGKKDWELYDLKDDPGQESDVAAQHPDLVKESSAAYDRWWQEVLPRLENEEAYKTAPKVNPFKEQFQKQFGTGK